jgi:RNA polymerase sigma-70 factor, ECF subfamily
MKPDHREWEPATPQAPHFTEGGAADAELVARTLAGDASAFAILVHRYTPVAHAVARAVVKSDADAEDVVQDAFLMAFKSLGTARDATRFRAWFLRIVRNRAYNVLEFRQVRRYEPLSGLEPSTDKDDPLLRAEQNDTRSVILAAIHRLKSVWREVLWLHDVEGLSHADIATVLGTSELMSRKHLMNARRALRADLQHLGENSR